MNYWTSIHQILVLIQHSISFIGVLIILSGVLLALYQYLYSIFTAQLISQGAKVNAIRLNLGRILILGLEFIVAADLIGTTTTPDYYAVGLLAIIVIIRTLLSFSLNRELMTLSKES
jgi:uncharacterized membrane protein